MPGTSTRPCCGTKTPTTTGLATSSEENTRLYTGRELDAATGLYYYRARWYDAGTGQFTTRDPLGFAAGDTNLYRYVGNRPAGSTDPSGLWEARGYWSGGAWIPWTDWALDWASARPRTEDECKLLELAGDDPALYRRVAALLDTLDRTWVLWGPNGCHRWIREFQRHYHELPPRDSFNMRSEVPIYIGFWYVGWKDHGVMVFHIKGQTVYLDKGYQGEGDHISFTPHPDLIYPGDVIYDTLHSHGWGGL